MLRMVFKHQKRTSPFEDAGGDYSLYDINKEFVQDYLPDTVIQWVGLGWLLTFRDKYAWGRVKVVEPSQGYDFSS